MRYFENSAEAVEALNAAVFSSQGFKSSAGEVLFAVNGVLFYGVCVVF